MRVKFQWDPEKAERNLRVHGVTFEDASSVFGDPLAASMPDPLHSEDEWRFVTIGLCSSGRLLVVVHVNRGEIVRIVSARPATRGEKRKYEQEEPS